MLNGPYAEPLPRNDIRSIEAGIDRLLELDGIEGIDPVEATNQQRTFAKERAMLLTECRVTASRLQAADRRCREGLAAAVQCQIVSAAEAESQIATLRGQ